MIIAYYPGAGGNRYLRMLQGHEWTKPHQGYDDLVTDQKHHHRYLYADSKIENSGVILTHCMNTPLIKKICPHREITVIIGDMKSCLRREWCLYGHARYCDRVHPTNQDILELYRAVRDPNWPEIENIEDIADLPAKIKTEFQQFQSALAARIWPVDPLAKLKKEYDDGLESAYATIQWHQDYYRLYPLDLSHCDTVIDIDEQNHFASVMKPELARYSSEIFDRCWNIIP